MKNNLIGKIITIVFISVITIELGVVTGYYFLNKMDLNKFKEDIKVSVLK